MENEDWQEIVASLVDAKRCLAHAWQLLDGSDATAPGVEHALRSALAGIDGMYAIEHVHAFNADDATQTDMQEFWDKHDTLPGFAVGT